MRLDQSCGPPLLYDGAVMWKRNPRHARVPFQIRDHNSYVLMATLGLQAGGRLTPEDVTGKELLTLVGSEAKLVTRLKGLHKKGWATREGHSCEHLGGAGMCKDQQVKFIDDWSETAYVGTERLTSYLADVYLGDLRRKYPELKAADDMSVLRLTLGVWGAWSFLVDEVAPWFSKLDRNEKRWLREHHCAIICSTLLIEGEVSGEHLLAQLVPEQDDTGCDRHRLPDMLGVLETAGLVRSTGTDGEGWRRQTYGATSRLRSEMEKVVVPAIKAMLDEL